MCAEPHSGEVILTLTETSSFAGLQQPFHWHFGRSTHAKAVTLEIEVGYRLWQAADTNFLKEFIVAVEFEAKGERRRLCNSCKMQAKSFKAPSLLSQSGVSLSSNRLVVACGKCLQVALPIISEAAC